MSESNVILDEEEERQEIREIMRLLTIDVEATGVNAKKDCIVTLFLGIMEANGEFSEKHEFLFNPGVEIPQEAMNVHGITNEHVQEHGIQVENHRDVFEKIRALIVDNIRDHNLPVVIYNAPYDTTIINSTLVRNGLNPIAWNDYFVIDPFVIDKAIDTYRKGARSLTSVATHYGIEVDETKTHDAAYDCYLTGRIVIELAKNPRIANMSRSTLHKNQISWKVEQSASLQAFLRQRENDETIVVDPSWPVMG